MPTKRFFAPADDDQINYAKSHNIYDITPEKIVKVIKKEPKETPKEDKASVTIKEVCNRGVLSEGRSSGMGFAMLKKIGENNFITVQPISPCKDYLNEVVFTENFGIGTVGCGLKYPQKNDIIEKDVVFMAIAAQTNHGGNGFYYNGMSFNQYKELLEKNYKNIESFLNFFDEKLELKPTKVTKANDDYYLVEFDKEWFKSTYSISLFSLLVRIAPEYDQAKHGDAISYLNSIPKNEKNIEMTLVKGTLPALNLILDTKKIPSQGHKFINRIEHQGDSPHHYGILTWKKEYETVEL